jgi:putative phosphoesterase
MTLGILADTHGYLDPRVHGFLQGVDEILHAGDIGQDEIVLELETLAPVTAVRGNMDRSGRSATYRDWLAMSFEKRRVFVVHDLGTPGQIRRGVSTSIRAYAPHVVIFGHTHTPYNRYHHDVLYFNPGSASRDRSGKGPSLGILEICDSHIFATHRFFDS